MVPESVSKNPDITWIHQARLDVHIGDGKAKKSRSCEVSGWGLTMLSFSYGCISKMSLGEMRGRSVFDCFSWGSMIDLPGNAPMAHPSPRQGMKVGLPASMREFPKIGGYLILGAL